MTKNEWIQITRYVSTVIALWLLLNRVPTKNDLQNALQPMQTQISLLTSRVAAIDNTLSSLMAERKLQR